MKFEDFQMKKNSYSIEDFASNFFLAFKQFPISENVVKEKFNFDKHKIL